MKRIARLNYLSGRVHALTIARRAVELILLAAYVYAVSKGAPWGPLALALVLLIPIEAAFYSGIVRPYRRSISVLGAKVSASNRREIAVIQKLSTSSMLFPELNYLDNLCFMADHRLPRIWMRTKCKAGIREEYASWLGADVFDKNIDELTQMQKYDLIYARILLQRPKVVFCVQPFMQADVEQRMHIWMLLERMLGKRISVVILAVNLADTLSLADRLIQLRDGRVLTTYERSQFGALPDSTPWHYLWSDGDRPREREDTLGETGKGSSPSNEIVFWADEDRHSEDLAL